MTAKGKMIASITFPAVSDTLIGMVKRGSRLHEAVWPTMYCNLHGTGGGNGDRTRGSKLNRIRLALSNGVDSLDLFDTSGSKYIALIGWYLAPRGVSSMTGIARYAAGRIGLPLIQPVTC